MITPHQPPSAVFTGALGDNASGQYFPARAEVHDGMVSLWVAPPTGWAQYFSVPAHEVVVKSAAQRITLVVRGQSYPLLADPGAVARGVQLGVAGTIAGALDRPRLDMGVNVARGVNLAGAAQAFNASGGPAFIAAAQQSGARSSRVGYGPILAIGCGAGLVIVIAVTAVTVFLLSP